MFHTNRVIERGKSTHTKPIWSTANMHMKTFISISPHRGILRLAGCNYKSSSCLKISRVAARGSRISKDWEQKEDKRPTEIYYRARLTTH